MHIFLMYVKNMKNFTLQRVQNMQFAVSISNTPVTLKQSQDHQMYSDNVHPKQNYNHAKFERSCFNGVQEKANVKVFFKQESM